MSTLQLLLIAVAVQLLTALLVLALARRDDPDPPRPRKRRRAPTPAAPEDAPEPWAIDEDVLELAGAASFAEPVLAYVNVPARSPDPTRFIQTEVLLPSGPAARTAALVKLAIALLGFGLALGLGIIVAARSFGALLRALSSL